MCTEPSEISCFISSLLIKQARLHGIANTDMFNGIPHDSIPLLTDHMEWTDFSTFTLLTTNIENAVADSDGHTIEQMAFDGVVSESGAFQLLFMQIAPLPVINRSLAGHVQTHLNRNLEVLIHVINDGLLTVTMRPIEKSRYNRLLCDISRGLILALVNIRGYKNCRLETITCICTNSNACCYRLTWEPQTDVPNPLSITGSFSYDEVIDYLEENQSVLRRQYDELRVITRELQQNQNNHRFICDNTIDVIWTFDLVTNKFTFFTPSIEKLRGYTPDEAMQQSLEETLTPESYTHIGMLLAEARHVAAEGKLPDTSYPVLVEHPCKNGSIVSTEVIVKIIIHDKIPVELIGVSRNITEKHKINKHLQNVQKIESLGALAGGIAHDFNNLLSGMFGYIDIAKNLIEQGSTEPGLKNLSKALGIFDRATSLTRQLLTFSKGGMPVKQTTVVSSLIANTVTFALTGSNVSPVFDINTTLWNCNIDGNQICQALDNIIINARQAMPSGGIIFVSAVNVSPEDPILPSMQKGHYVKITIRDQGMGIVPENIGRIFDPFFTTKKHGSGLGLAMTYSILSKHGGGITVESKHGSGASFTLYLPALPDAVPLQKTAPNTATGVGGTILVMDDEDYILDIASKMLVGMGYTVVTASNGTDALQKFIHAKDTGHPINAVILDFTIPGGMGGKETMKHLLELEPDIRGIISSGYADDPLMHDPQQFGFAGKLKKPYSKNDLADVLHNVLSIK